ncbi:hypothetical protein FHT71_004589 [Rhizobium sp. BK060]|nr:hypothetical protein [Rhizobium sp. BK060]
MSDKGSSKYSGYKYVATAVAFSFLSVSSKNIMILRV